MSQYSLLAALKNNPMFTKLDDYSYQIIEHYLSFKALEEGDILFNEGDRGDFMAIVVAGSLDILKKINPVIDDSVQQQLPIVSSIAPTIPNPIVDASIANKPKQITAVTAMPDPKKPDTVTITHTESARSKSVELEENMTRLSVIYAGDSIGEMSIIDELPRSATVRALEKTGLIILQKKDFDRIIENYPRIGINMLKGITTKLSINLRRTSDTLSKERKRS